MQERVTLWTVELAPAATASFTLKKTTTTTTMMMTFSPRKSQAELFSSHLELISSRELSLYSSRSLGETEENI